MQQHRSGSRVLFCDPPGHSDVESLCGFGSEVIQENDYVFLHDQEPIHLDLHKSLFDSVIIQNKSKRHVIVSELGENADQLHSNA